MSTNEVLKMLYKECMKLDPAETEEEQEFYSMISDFVLQQRQRKVIEENRF